MSHNEPRPSNLAESFDNIPAIDDDEQSREKFMLEIGGTLMEKSIIFSRRRG